MGKMQKNLNDDKQTLLEINAGILILIVHTTDHENRMAASFPTSNLVSWFPRYLV